MAAMMPAAAGGSSNTPYGGYDNDAIERDLIDPDDATLDDLDDPVAGHSTSDRAPLTGNIQGAGASRSNQSTQSYLTSQIPGEDRRAPTSTIDESVWQTLSRDLLAVWEKLRLVLWPKYLLGGMLVQGGGGIGGEERGEAGQGLMGGEGSLADRMRGVVGRWPDADVVLQGGMSEGLRDWDLWGPLLFCLLLSLFLSWSAQGDQKELVFSGVFSMIWVGEAVVTFQIKLLGGNISFFQSVSLIGYTLFPLVIASVLSAFRVIWFVRLPIDIVLIIWSLAAGVSILGGSGVLRNRVALAVYPLFIFYIGVGTLCFIS